MSCEASSETGNKNLVEGCEKTTRQLSAGNKGTSFSSCLLNIFGGPTYWSVVASLSFLCTGLLRAYTSPALLSIQNESPSLIASSTATNKNDIISWIASTAPLASFLGTILSGPLLLHWGRQKTLFLLSCVATGGWVLVGNSWSIPCLLLGRGLTGLASGLATATAPLYISEVVNAKFDKNLSASSGGDRRGLLPGMMLATGILLGFLLAHQIQIWRRLALVIAVFPGVLALLSWTIPESPFWLSRDKSSQGEEEEDRMKKEIQFDLQMEQVVPPPSRQLPTKEKKFSEKSDLIPKSNSSSWFSPVTTSYFRVGLLMLLQQWSGGNVLIYYLSEILTKNLSISSPSTPGTIPDEATIHQASLIIALVQFIGFFLALPLIEHPRLGRRSLLMISSVLMMMAHLFLAFHFHHMLNFPHTQKDANYQNNSKQPNNLNHLNNPVWLPSNYDFLFRVTSLAALLAAYSTGLGPIPFLFIENPSATTFSRSESHHPGIKVSRSSYLSSFASLVNHLALFLAVKGFPYLFHHGPDLSFWLFAGICWSTTLFAFYFLPADQ